MDWSIAGYDSHPIDGEASLLETCANHLGEVAGDIRDQITRLRGINSSEIWESTAGSADAFQEVVEDLPEKLELVATRYERVNEALAEFYPTLASTKEDAEFWIGQAEDARDEVERTQTGVEEMEDFESNAEDGETWEGEDYGAGLEAAQGDLDTAIGNVQNAVSAFESAAETCADAIDEASNDDLKNEGGFFGISISFDDFLDFVEVVVDVLNVIAVVIGVIALFVPGLNLIALGVAAAILAGTVLLYANDRASGWDVAFASLGFAAAGIGAVAGGWSNMMRGGRFARVLGSGVGDEALQYGTTIYRQAAVLDAVDGLANFGGLALGATTNAPGWAEGIQGMTGDDVAAAARPVDVDVPDLTQNASAPVPAGVN